MWFPTAGGVALAPMQQLLVRGAGNGRGDYESTGDDPQFDVRPDGGFSVLPPGWYRLSVQLVPTEGQIIEPCLYPDYGEGASETTRIDLPEPDAAGLLNCVVLIRATLRTLRFDPTVERARFTLTAPTFSRISPWRAAGAMLRGIQAASGCTLLGETLPAAAGFARRFARCGFAAAADLLIERYVSSFRRDRRDYQHWIALFDSYSPARLEQGRSRAAALASLPLISIVLPVHDTPVEFLRRCIDSVLAQTFVRWQLCIADDASSGAVRRVLREYAERDRRIQLHLRDRHGHICETTNDALERAQGQYTGFLDHDDELAPDALFEVAKALVASPDARLVYSDEDKIDRSGRRFDPNFKPAWNPDLLRAQNYICHFAVFETALVRSLGGLRPGFEGAQDHDLLLRCIEKLRADQIVHVPKVLYHWRAIPGSTALGGGQKRYALEAGRRAVEEHLARTGVVATVEAMPSGYYKVVRAVASPQPTATIVIPTRDRRDLLEPCIRSIVDRTRYASYDIVVVDNGSADPDARDYLDQLQMQPRITVLDHPAPFNFSAVVNHGARHATGEVLCILNNDVEVISEGWLHEMVAQATRPDIGVVGAMLYYPDDTIQHAGVVLGIGGVAGHIHGRLHRGDGGYLGRAGITHNVAAVTAACMAVRRRVFDRVGGFDEGLPVAFNDVDFCIRVSQLGYFNLWTPHAELYHHESATRGLEDTPEKRARFASELEQMKRRWGGVLQHDPAYNPNLSLEGLHFELAFPPRSRSGRCHAPTATTNTQRSPHDLSDAARRRKLQTPRPWDARRLA
ncbi:glycosyltransferase family 2 protein [Lysobacter sp. D1-1-M9]|uniref:glycosyltransferase family 2 protein n=1 Tax=Novilysobacter longmucuonensis TaxID=3098603 RepID=UPI002FCB8106